MSNKPIKTGASAKKAWVSLGIDELDVPSATRNSNGRLQPGEGFNFYRNS